jgi:GNAT superfamily N-acetyltransferase
MDKVEFGDNAGAPYPFNWGGRTSWRQRAVLQLWWAWVVLWGGVLAEASPYRTGITPPAEYFGFEVGERHLTHAEVYGYMRMLASESDRVRIEPYGRTHGQRQLIQLIITSEDNADRLEAMRLQHLGTLGKEAPRKIDVEEQPLIIHFNYGIHGNEPSASNAAVWVAYHLAASEDPAMKQLLEGSVILLDPVLNPDGFDRFANWANAHVGRNPNPDPNTLEHNEAWPYGRTNYYWFDLNRDWMLLTQPESQGRLPFYHRWLPHLVLDFHEMGTESTYFFQPGVPERTHPLIPEATYALTERVAAHFASAFDEAGALYFTKERFDDFYPGKGSTVSDLKGAVGILFEQASARGMVQESENGDLTFRMAIENQVRASMAVLEGAAALRGELIRNTYQFYQDSLKLAGQAGFAGYRFAAGGDPARAAELAAILKGHDIEVWPTAEVGAWFVPIEQPQYRYLEALFEERTQFEQNLFYDITAWTLPLAFNVEVTRVDRIPERGSDRPQASHLEASELGYLIDWSSVKAPKAVLDLLEEAVLVKVGREPFTLEGEVFGSGTIFVPVALQKEKAETIHRVLLQAARRDGVRVVPVKTYLTEAGPDLGSNSFFRLERPAILLVADAPLDPYETGTVWHLLDVLHDYPVTLVRRSQLERMDLSRYNALVLPTAWGQAYGKGLVDKVRDWVRGGGHLVCLGNAAEWAIREGVVSTIREREDQKADAESPAADSADKSASAEENGSMRRPFAAAADDKALERIRGAIFQTEVDLTHPLAYGIGTARLPVFVESEFFLEPSSDPYQTPLIFTDAPLLSGYASTKNLQRMTGAAAAAVEPIGSGAVILFGHSPTFRAYWRGTEKLLLNALLFGGQMRP